jgi:hypothetical protein
MGRADVAPLLNTIVPSAGCYPRAGDRRHEAMYDEAPHRHGDSARVWFRYINHRAHLRTTETFDFYFFLESMFIDQATHNGSDSIHP